MLIDDLSSGLYAPEMHEGIETCAIGWLGHTVPTQGKLPADVLPALRQLRNTAFHDDNDLGKHECEICGMFSDRGELWLEAFNVRYVAPAMITHYCEAHSYTPPRVFIDELLNWWRAMSR